MARGLDLEHEPMPLWSFEGATHAQRPRLSQFSAVIAAGVPLFPFRTEQLSPPAPMVLGGQPPGRVGRRRINERRAARPFFSWSRFLECSEPPDPFTDRRMRAEQPAEPALFERVDDMQRPGCRIPDERDQLARLIEPCKRIREPVGRVAEPGGALIRGELPARRQEPVDDGRSDRAEDEQKGPLEPAAETAQLEQGCRDYGGGRLDEHVTTLRMGELMGEDSVEFCRWKRAEEPRTDDDRLAAAASPPGEGLWETVHDQIQARSGNAGTGREPFDGR